MLCSFAPFYCNSSVLFGTVFHQSWFYSMLHAHNVSVLIWECYSGQLNQANCGSKSLICREYCVAVETVYLHGIF